MKMSTQVTLFGNTSKAALALLSGIEDTLTSTIAGGAGGSKRISIEGGAFREFLNGKEVRVSEDRSMNVIIINAAPVSRIFFDGAYVKGQKIKPMCWSSDTQSPDKEVPEDQRQAKHCKDCKQHIKGSGQGDTRACRFQQRIAVAFEGELNKETVYQLTLPSTSVFGDAEGKKMPLQAYGRHLKAYNTPAISVVTEMRFDINSSTPKLVFSPVRALEEDELRIAVSLQNHPDTIKAITMNVSQMDGVIPEPKDTRPMGELTKEEDAPTYEKIAEKAAPKAAKVEVEDVPEPIKVTKKSTPAVAEKSELSDIVGDWDD
jgi:hypothetical protein